MIKVESISKHYEGRSVVDGISFEAFDQEILILLGTSGCGKTTTLKMINRLIETDTGHISINGQNIRDKKMEDLRMGIGFIMQHTGLFPHYTIQENIATVPKLLKWDKKHIQNRTYELMHKLHLSTDMLIRYPHELSGGQQQRVGIIRALIANTPVLLMDEPFGALDNITKSEIHTAFKSLDELKNKTTILVTHDVQEAFELGHRIALMDKGKILQIGTPKEMIYHPKNNFVSDFFASNRLLLEHKVTTLADLETMLLIEDIIQPSFSARSTVWSALQHLSRDKHDFDRYEKLSKAFAAYRKMQIA
ncbi:ABC transporter ATP-binding protein [Sphingobacterium sp. PCS056]|uniref:ATP-binding cassette domain-containing protein n=1 Tax=Sphingobacterium sp. PCS056 TaxID=2931400 RepID=UPI00200FC99B|nr:ABC transporter ATP-binding protein [Sphingobacterium sp. PCS056]UPZ34764.1 ABC transporter ATP-binding protein [Sphingobacterium sp. PCS056]